MNIDFTADSSTASLLQAPRQEASNLPPGSLARSVVITVKAEPIAEVVEVANVIREILGELDGDAYGITKVFLDGRRAEVRSRQTNLGNLTAAELRDLLEELVKGNFGHTAGLRVEFDRSFAARADGDTNRGLATDGQQVREMAVCLGEWNAGVCGGGWESVVTNGVTQPTGTTYRVVALDFLAACAAPLAANLRRRIAVADGRSRG